MTAICRTPQTQRYRQQPTRCKPMLSKIFLALLYLCSTSLILEAQQKFKLNGAIAPERDTPIVDVDYTGPAPAGDSPYLLKQNWKARWSSTADGDTTPSTVESVTVDTQTRKIELHLAGALPSLDNMVRSFWTVLFVPPDTSPDVPQVISFAPNAVLLPDTSGKDCKNKTPDKMPLFCPPAAGQSPDLSFSGNFLAAGGTKPIYSFSIKGNPVLNKTFLGFSPGASFDVEINQNVQPPNNRTRFDPDSINVGLSFTRAFLVQEANLYGVNLQVGLPTGEFSRSDPSSNIVASGLASFVLNAWQPKSPKSLYGTLYPLIGFEIGHNLNKPSQIDSVPVNLASYNGIFRGILGGDATLAVASPDRKSNVFSITGSYRLRLPTMDEPFVRTLHQVTAIDLTTKGRNWVEADINWSPLSFKYVSLTGKYQYGSLPPIFNLVDHKFALGLTFQAVQTRKPSLAPAIK